MDDQQAIELMQREKEIYATSSERKGDARPSDLPTRSELLREFSYTNERLESTGNLVISHVYPPCTKPLVDLEPILLEDLRLETAHHGKLLVLRTFGVPKLTDGVLNGVEDAKRDVVRLALHHCACECLPRGQLVAVKELYYRVTVDGDYVIRVDHPSNLIILLADNAVVPAGLREADLGNLCIDDAK